MIGEEVIIITRTKDTTGEWFFMIVTADLIGFNTETNKECYQIDERTYNKLQKILQETIIEKGENPIDYHKYNGIYEAIECGDIKDEELVDNIEYDIIRVLDTKEVLE